MFTGGDESVISKVNPLFALLGNVNYMRDSGKGQFAKLANQITIASAMVGLVEGIISAHKAGPNVELFLSAISTGAAGTKSLDLYGSRILKRDFELVFCESFCERFGDLFEEVSKYGACFAWAGSGAAALFCLSKLTEKAIWVLKH